MDAGKYNIIQLRYNQKGNKHIAESASLPTYLQPASISLRMKGDALGE